MITIQNKTGYVNDTEIFSDGIPLTNIERIELLPMQSGGNVKVIITFNKVALKLDNVVLKGIKASQ